MESSERVGLPALRIRPFLRDDRGGNELLGFALLAILVCLACIAILGDLGDEMVAGLTAIRDGLYGPGSGN